MWNTLFPRAADNSYKGPAVVLWVLSLFVLKSLFAGSVHLFALDGGAQSIGSVALKQLSQAGADSVVTMFGMWGLEQLVIGLIAAVVLWRYKSLVSMIWLAYAVEYALRGLARTVTPGLLTSQTPPGAVADNLLIPLSIVMFLLSLYIPKKKR